MSQENKDKSEVKNIVNPIENKKEKTKSESRLKKYIKHINFKKVLPILLIIIICLGVGFYGGREVGRNLPATHKYYSKSQVLATVGDEKITGEDFSKRMEPLYYYYGLKKLSNEEIESYEANNINYMTNLEALYLAAEDEDVTVTDDEVTSYYESTMSSIESMFNMTEDEFLDKFNLTKSYVKQNLKKELIATTYLEESSEVSDTEAENYYNKNKDDFLEVSASHILISNYNENNEEVSDEQKEENKELAEKVLKKALAGDDFSNLALEYSDDDYTASDSGNLGYFSEGDMEDSFEKAVFSIEIGEIYPEVVETSYGYHIIKKTGEQYSSFEDVKDSLIETLSSNKQTTLLKNAQEKYKVTVNM